ncbi:MAG: extracellular solute-binding protein [Candidatus Pristimantibacillus lignocellulolyticus]|uniref:Extracellular solute-binding protein n=1 Tax=Candidatus Pristimantibacillus lignocellulolyticus TaxID=2994561 RepID=A0A9J6ZJD5_9BACL|nr:MAG: extracellular solute-binding protein [Candidatus Pristimantibacillus lignocellulolyticus]
MKNKRVTKLTLLVLLTFSLLLGACSNNSGGNKTTPTPTPQNTQNANNTGEGEGPATATDPRSKVIPVTFSQFVNYDWYTAPTWEERPHGAWITENLQVTMVPEQSNGAAAQKLNGMIVSNTLPDTIVLDKGKDVERLVSAGKLVALDPYLEKYPEFVETIGVETLNMLRSEDGKLYQIPNWYISGDNGNGNAAYLVNKKIYKELGSPSLATWTELEAYLKLVKEKYPDVVPLDAGEVRDGAELQLLGMLYSGAADGNTPTFISPGAGSVFGVPQGDQLVSIYEDKGFADAVLYLNRLFRQNLVTQDLFTQTRDQINEKLRAGKVAVFAAYDSVVEGIGREANNMLKATDPEAGYEVIWPVHQEGVDKNKVYPSGYNTLGWNVNVITTNAKDPEAIFSFMNWATSEEGQRIIFFGPEGLFYDSVEDGVPIPNDAYINRDPKKYDELKIGEFNWYGNTSYIDVVKGKREKLLPEEAQDWTTIAQTTVSFLTSLNITEYSNLDPLPDSEEGIILQRLKDYYKQAIPQMIYAKSDEEVTALLKKAAEETKGLGYQTVLDWKTAKWQENRNLMK